MQEEKGRRRVIGKQKATSTEECGGAATGVWSSALAISPSLLLLLNFVDKRLSFVTYAQPPSLE
jgi:hypothetical protein